MDATNTNCLAKYVNDSPNGNCVMKKILVDDVPFLCLFATCDISAEMELRYSYGDPKKVNLWWRNNVSFILLFREILVTLFQEKFTVTLEINYDIDGCIKSILQSMVEQSLIPNLYFVKLKWTSKPL